MSRRYLFTRRSLHSALATMTAISTPIIVSIPSQSSTSTTSPDQSHHVKGGGFVNPWSSFEQINMNPSTMYKMWTDWKSPKIPPPDQLPPFIQPVTFGIGNKEMQGKIKATWLGHAAFLVEFPRSNDNDERANPNGSENSKRGVRVLFDPIFSHRCSPSQIIGPARITEPPCKISDIPEIDCVVISHNHYDHLDIATLQKIYKQSPNVHFFVPLGNRSWFKSNICGEDQVTELDWWNERDVTCDIEGVKEKIRITCTPCQHFTGRGIMDRNETLWASWAVVAPKGRVWFAGDTGYKSVARGATTEEGLATCPAFKQIGDKFGGFDLSMIPIGAYSPRWFMSRVHCAPEDSVELFLDTKSRKAIPMHHSTWVLTDEPLTEPPQRLRAACEKKGITKEQFDVCGFGETIAAEATSRCDELL